MKAPISFGDIFLTLLGSTVVIVNVTLSLSDVVAIMVFLSLTLKSGFIRRPLLLSASTFSKSVFRPCRISTVSVVTASFWSIDFSLNVLRLRCENF